MKTEEIQRTTRGRDPYEVSRALQDVMPRSWSMLDRHGRPVPLSAAGYVLRFGQAYRLRIVSPFPAEDVEEVKIINPPAFLIAERTLVEKDEQGQLSHTLPFKVTLDLWTHLRKLGATVYGDDLEVVHYFRPGVFREAQSFLCPIVARPRWGIIAVAVVVGLLLLILEKLATGFFFPERPILESLRDALERMSRANWWLQFMSIALTVWLVVTAVNVAFLYKRSRELRAEFKETYPA
jgi:hypothetical protein